MEDELQAAYDRLDAALAPPGDTAALVAARVSARRRRRSVVVAAGAAAVVLIASGATLSLRGDSDTAAPGPAAPDTSPTAEQSPEAPATTPSPGEPLEPTAHRENLTCPGPTTLAVVGNPEVWLGGAPYGPETVQPWLLPEAGATFRRVDEDEVVARLTTQKGELYAELGLIAIDQTWRVGSVALCNSKFPGASSVGQTLTTKPIGRVTAVSEGHCWIDTLDTLGQSWDLKDEDQFGFGGLGPDGFLGLGQATARADLSRLHYVDLSGAELNFVPADSPGTDANDGLCD